MNEPLSKRLVFFLIILSLLTPLVSLNQLFFSFIVEKTLYSRIIIGTILFVGACSWITESHRRLSVNLLDVSIVFFLVVLLLIDWGGVNFRKSIWSNFERMEGFWTYLLLAIYYFFIRHYITTTIRWIQLMSVACCVALVVIVLGFVYDSTSIEQVGRMSSTLGNPIFLSVYLLFHLFFASFILLYLFDKPQARISQKITWVFLWLIFNGICTYTIILTRTRATIISLGIGIIFFLIWQLFSQKTPSFIRKSVVAIMVLVLCAIPFLYTLHSTHTLVLPKTVTSMVSQDRLNSITSRLVNWQIALNGFKEKPLLGWGQENYIAVFAKYYIPVNYEDAPWYDHSHNLFLDWLVAGGIVGFMAFLALFVTSILLVVQSKQCSHNQKGIYLAMQCAFLFSCFFAFNSITALLLMFLILAYASFLNKEPGFLYSILYPPKVRFIAILLAVGFSIFTFSSLILKPLKTNKNIINLVKETDLMSLIDNIGKFYRQSSPTGSAEMAEQASFLAPKVLTSQVNNELKYAYYNATSAVLDKELETNTEQAKTLSIRGSLASDFNDLDRAIVYLEKVKKLAPKRHINLMQLGLAYAKKNDVKNATDTFQYLFETNPANEEPLVYKAIVFMNIGDTTNAYGTIRELSNKGIIKHIKLVKSVYEQNNNLAGFLRQMKRRESKETPRNPFVTYYTKEVYIEWARASYQIGDRRESGEIILRYIWHIHRQHLHLIKPFRAAIEAGDNPEKYFKYFGDL